jgi:pimeloyl-ACP methyl ester carboxylesterase
VSPRPALEANLGAAARLPCLAALAIAACASGPAGGGPAATAGAVPIRAGHAPVNGIRLYDEIHGAGAGTPLVLLPGGGSTIEATYGRILPQFARQRRLIAIEEQNHGRSDHRDVPQRFTTSADDVAALLAHLGVEQADVMGFSNGASVALQVAIRHPARVRKLIFASSVSKRSGAPPQFWEMIRSASFADMPQALKDAFLKVNPDPARLRDMYEKDIERMRNFVDTPDEAVRGVKAPALIIAGDRDVPTPEHSLELARLLPRARLMLLPAGHGDYLGELLADRPASRYPELIAAAIAEFLDGPS